MKIQYEGMNKAGFSIRGTLDNAESKDDAREKLKARGITATSLVEVRRAAAKTSPGTLKKEIKLPKFLSGMFLKKNMNTKELTTFTRQLSTLLESGVPIVKALGLIGEQDETGYLRRLMDDMCESLNGGTPVPVAFAEHPNFFPTLYVNMVSAGDASGKMAEVLANLADYMEKSEKIKNKVKGAMAYPCVVLFMSVAILIFLMTAIIPKFQEIFKDLMGGSALPPLTQMVMGVSYAVREHYLSILIPVVVLVFLVRMSRKTKVGKAIIDRMVFGMPLFGKLFKKTAMARLSRTLGTLMSSGVQILPALTLSKSVSGNSLVSNALDDVHDAVKEGDELADVMGHHKVFPRIMVGMVKVGTSTGKTPEMLNKVADAYENEVDSAVAGLTSTIEPLLIVFLAIMVGTIVIALFLPLISIISKLSG